MFDIGSSLREARTRQGLDFDEMETRTKVRAKYLRYLEEERFDQLPGHTYTKGFLRVYADALGLDGDLYVDEYNSRYVASDDELLARIPRSPTRDPRRRRRGESRAVIVALAAILLMTALVIAAWRFGSEDAPRVQGVNAAAKAAGAGAQPIRLVVRAVGGASFMEVRAGSVAGAPLYTGTLERGQTQRFTKKALYLEVAKPRNVVVLVNGSRMALPKGGRLTIAGAAAVK
jgi:transcriptional regulator with XRE-family HTH domain